MCWADLSPSKLPSKYSLSDLKCRPWLGPGDTRPFLHGAHRLMGEVNPKKRHTYTQIRATGEKIHTEGT